MTDALVPVIVGMFVLYAATLFGLSRGRTCNGDASPDGLFFVFVVPCLNEEEVIATTLDRLLALPGDDHAVLVVDDASDDATFPIVEAVSDERVWLLRRSLPEARLGKGQALNAAFRYLRDVPQIQGRNNDDVIVCVMDADGRLDPNALNKVGPHFADRRTGAVQVGVRMTNAGVSLLTRLQDLEFAIFTQIFQTARRLMGSVGLGGNGQFTRLSALESLGEEPWSDSLTEDLDLGLRLLTNGWKNDFCAKSYVGQQAVPGVGRLARQRTRWFHGHMQSWKRIPDILKSQLAIKTTADLVFYLTSPILVLILSPMIFLFYGTLVALLIASPGGAAAMLFDRGWTIPVLGYALSFGAAPLYGVAYWKENPDYGLWRSLAVAHLFNVYTYVWTAAAWTFLYRLVFRRRAWTKTARSSEGPRIEIRVGRESSPRPVKQRCYFERFVAAGVPPEAASRMTLALWTTVSEIYFASWGLTKESMSTSENRTSASSV
jgi:1,2-diacylglycerol 3-beta-glucosyltransferase